MRDSPNGGTEAVRVTFLSPTLPHGNCHSDFKMSHDLPIIDMRVQRIHSQLLCILDWPKRYSGGQDM